MPKDFWNLPVNPVWRVPGFMKEGKADNEHSNPVLLPLVPEFTNICISHLQLLHFPKFFVKSRRDWEKKCRIGIRQLHNSFFPTKFKFFGLNFEKFCCVIRNWDRNFQIYYYHLFTQILKQDNSIFRGLSDFRYAFWKARAFFERTSIVRERNF
jgi:hypothetical protein